MSSKTFSTLYRKTKSGKIQQWRIWTEDNRIYTEYGLLDGKKHSDYKEAGAKNVGRSNETTPTEQAQKEAQSAWQKKLDRKYSETIEEALQPDYFPMLAKPMDESKITFPCDLQRKLDGVRCLAFWDEDYSEIKLMSRGGKYYDVPYHLKDQIAEILPEEPWILDGEIYQHGKTFQYISSRVKKYYEGETEQLDFYAYDVVSKRDPENPWRNRRQGLSTLLGGSRPPENVIMVQSVTVNTLDEIWEYHQQFEENGYEGAMVRLLDSPYTFNHRSNGLFKIKAFQDDEFEIIGYKEGEGRLRGCVVWLCETEDGGTFEVSQTGPLEERRKLFEEADKYVGKFLKVKYFGHTESGLPRIPTGLGIRLEADL